jgi:hypothetical protein
MDEKSAEIVSREMLDLAARLDASIALMQIHLPPTDYVNYRGAVGELMGRMLIEFMNPLYKQYPALKPPQLR